MGKQHKTVQCPKCFTLNAEDSLYCSKCGSVLEGTHETLTYIPGKGPQQKEVIDFFPGESFGDRYQIIEEIGRGGMGRVYKAEDKELGITVALKMIRPEYSSKPRFIKLFKKETLLARSISHENVIRIHDLGEVDEIKYISMEYIKGQNLKELIRTSGTLTVETTISIIRQICEALKVAHQKGIVHRDLKPQNIMIDNNGRVYTMDFGLAKSFEAQETSISRAIVGTPPYLSPEQAKGEKADQRSDIYSLGIIIYEMLTGKQPFEAETTAGYIHKHIHEKPASPAEINPLIPFYLERIILKCLEKDKEQRYQNVEELLKDLEAQKVKSRLLLSRTRTQRLLKYTFATVLILIIALGAYLLIVRKKPEILPPAEGGRIPVAVMYFENNTGDKNLDHLRKTIPHLIIQDLYQSTYIRPLTTDTLVQIHKELNLIEVTSYSTEDLKRVAARGSADHILLGNYTKTGDTFRINTVLQKITTKEHIGSPWVEGKGVDQVTSMVDELTKRIKIGFNLSEEEITRDIDKEVGKINTDSPDALKYYMEGLAYANDGKFKESNKVLKKAVDIDPGFAMAYWNISSNYHYLGQLDQSKKHLQTALSLLDRISEREQYLIQGYQSYVLNNSPEKAIEIYQKLLKIYPDDEDANESLAVIYRNLEEWDLAFDHFEKVLKINKRDKVSYLNLADIYMAKGLYDKARELLLKNQHVFSNQANFYYTMSFLFFKQGKVDLALLEAKKSVVLDPDNLSYTLLMGNLYHTKGDLVLANNFYRQLLENEDLHIQLRGRFWMVHLCLTKGEYDKCKKEVILGIKQSRKSSNQGFEIDFFLISAYLNLKLKNFTEALNASNQAKEVAFKINFEGHEKQALLFRGLVFIEMNRIDEAEKTGSQLRQLIDNTGNKKHMRLYYYLKGMIFRQKGLISQAIDFFEMAYSFLPYQISRFDEHAFYLDALASTEEKSGNIENAQQYFEKISSLTTGRLTWGDIYARSFYMLGKIYQKKGWNGKAIEHFEKFLYLWNNADPDLTETEDARNQLAILKNISQE